MPNFANQVTDAKGIRRVNFLSMEEDCTKYYPLRDFEFMMPWSMDYPSATPQNRKTQKESLRKEACILETKLRTVKDRIRDLELLED